MAASLLLRRVRFASRLVVPYDEGRSRIVADLRTALGLRLFRYGLRDPDIALVRTLLSPGDIFVDGGANVGLFTLAAAARVGPMGRVLAFEPAPETAGMLRRNIALNSFHWVRVLEAALGETAGARSFTAFSGDAAGFSSFVPEDGGGGTTCEVRVLRLDDVIGRGELRALRLIKLDLEGAEVAALAGAARVLRESDTDLLIEVEPAHLARQGASDHQLLELLTSQGYRLFRATASGDRPCLCEVAEPAGCNVFATRRLERVRGAGVAVAAP